MIRIGGFVFLVVFLSFFASAQVAINEVELNSEGSDSGREWVELVNYGSADVNISGWRIFDGINDGIENVTLRRVIPDGTVLGSRDIYVVTLVGAFLNEEDFVVVKDAGESIIDSTPMLLDEDNGNETWARVPDGFGEFAFQDATKGFSNVPVEISELSVNDACLVYGESVRMFSNVGGFCVSEVDFLMNFDGSEREVSGEIFEGETYVGVTGSSSIGESKNVSWNVRVLDCYGNHFVSSEQEFYVNAKTVLEVLPAEPDGLNQWYVSGPVFTLTNADADEIKYRWDSEAVRFYGTQFGIENAPNNANVTGGFLDLNYWSSLCGGSEDEAESQKIVKVDMKSPEVNNLQPEMEEIVFSSRPIIEARIDEVYNTNSGVNLDSVRMFVNGGEVFPEVSAAGSLDATVSFFPDFDLPDGNNTITINSSDKAGRNSEFSWIFVVDSGEGIGEISFDVTSPELKNYSIKKIPINLSLDREAKIEYINYRDVNPRYKTLCNDCESYGLETKKFFNLKDGPNMIGLRVSDDYGHVGTYEINFTIDTKMPKISLVDPRNNENTNGSNFLVKYTEENLQSVRVVVNNSFVFELEDCESGMNKICSIDLDLSDFDGESLEYYFEVQDIFSTKESSKSVVKVDSTEPAIFVESPTNLNYTMRVPVNLTVSEKSKIEYYDSAPSNPRWKRLCSKCESYGFDKKREIRFSEGTHLVSFRATDEAGNTDVETVEINVV